MEILLFIFPLLSFLIFQFLGNKKGIKTPYILNTLFICSSFCLSIYLFINLLYLENDLPLYFYPILKSEYFSINWSLRLDLFVSGLIFIITLVGSIFTIYTINFYKDDKTYFNIIKFSSLLIFGSLTLVSSNDLIQFFVGWQIITLSSYLIINFSKKQNNFNNGSVFLLNRLSDLSVFLCLYFLYSITNSVNFDVIFESNYLSKNIELNIFDFNFSNFELISFVLFLSFLFRCRQFFVQRSEYHFSKIKTSILALLYSGIYLPSGIYFILRFLSLTHTNYHFFNIITLLGLFLIIIFTLLFFTSKDLKSLALYVACSQFSILIFLVGLKIFNAVFFYLLTSTLSVTMLFIGFSIIITKLNGEHQINKMGSLLNKTPATFLFILIGSLSLIGVPFFSGFYSKTLIFSALSSLNEVFMFFVIFLCFCYMFVLSYTLFKNIFITFLCQNNCDIHLYNKIKEKMFITKLLLVLLSICIISSGWFLNNLFSGSNPEYFWNLALNINTSFSLSLDNQIYDWFIEQTNIVCLIGILLSIFNYFLIPKIGNNIKIRNNKIFKYYSSYLSSNN